MPKLSPEEKAAKKAELKRLAELKKRQNRHDYLSREFKYGRLTSKLHERNWRKMLIDISLPRMRQELLLAWHTFETVTDTKDFTISLLMDEIRDAEEQRMVNLRSHSENIDILITRFGERMEELKESHEKELASMQSSANKEVEGLRENEAAAGQYFKTMLFGLEMASKEQKRLVRGDYLSRIDEETTKYGDKMQNLRAGLEKRYSAIWDKTKSFLHNYTVQKEERRKACTALATQDEALQDLCGRQRTKLYTMHEFLKKLKFQYNNLQETQGMKISDLHAEQQYLADAFNILKGRCDKDRAFDKNNLADLTITSNKTVGYLQAIAKKGQRLLELSAVCRKLETAEEKILPFPMIPESTHSHPDIKIVEYKNTANLQLFWQRTAQADAIRHSINEEREALKRENKLLKEKIHQYCQCLDCSTFHDNQKSKTQSTGSINIVDGYITQKNNMKH